MFSRFFIYRPIFASVLSIIITLAGGIAVWVLPIAQYPEITPPTVEVSACYPGADAKVVADTVAAPIEQQVNGVENMMYMSSQCNNDGSYSLTVTFNLGVSNVFNSVSSAYGLIGYGTYKPENQFGDGLTSGLAQGSEQFGLAARQVFFTTTFRF